MKNKCWICSNQTFSKPFDNGRFSVVECSRCQYGIVTPIPSDAELNELYNSKEYFSSHMQYDYDRLTDQEIEKLIQRDYQLHYKNLEKYLQGKESLLEIGPGGGFNLRAFEKAGLKVKGVETSSSSAAFAQTKLHLPIVNSSLEKYKDNKQYDIVMLNHVLEHFVDLHRIMLQLKNLVAKSGLLYIRVPDHDSYDRKAFKEKWPAYLPFHISYFSEKSLTILLTSYGFKIVEVKKYVSEKFLEKYPSAIKKTGKKIVAMAGLTSMYSGRTITIIAKKQ